MKQRSKLLIGALIAVIALTLMPAASFAQGGPDPQPPQPPQIYRNFPGGELIQALIGAAAQALNMTPEELRNALREGQSPADLIKAHKVSREQVAEAMQQAWNDEGARIIDQFIEQGMAPGRAPLAKFGRQFANSRQWSRTLAQELGMTPAEIGKALRSGQTLEEIAQAHGKTVQDVVDAIIAAEKARLDQAVADGKLTQEEADAILDRIDKKADAWTRMDGALMGNRPIKGMRTSAIWVRAAAEALDMPVADFMQALRSGQTPAQIAEAHGSSGQALVDAIVSAQRERLEIAVSAGNMTQDRMDRILSRVEKTVSKWVERGLPQPRSGQ